MGWLGTMSLLAGVGEQRAGFRLGRKRKEGRPGCVRVRKDAGRRQFIILTPTPVSHVKEAGERDGREHAKAGSDAGWAAVRPAVIRLLNLPRGCLPLRARMRDGGITAG